MDSHRLVPIDQYGHLDETGETRERHGDPSARDIELFGHNVTEDVFIGDFNLCQLASLVVHPSPVPNQESEHPRQKVAHPARRSRAGLRPEPRADGASARSMSVMTVPCIVPGFPVGSLSAAMRSSFA